MQLLLSVQGDTGKHGQKDAMKILNRLSRSFRNTGKASKHEHVHIFNWCFKLRFQTHVDRNESVVTQASSCWRVSFYNGFEVIRRVSQYRIQMRKYSALQVTQLTAVPLPVDIVY